MTAADYDEAHALWRQCEGVRLSALDERFGFERFLARNPGLSLTARIDGKLAAEAQFTAMIADPPPA